MLVLALTVTVSEEPTTKGLPARCTDRQGRQAFTEAT